MSRADALYLSEAELAARLGVPKDEWDAIAPKLERRGLPAPDPVFGGRRYWPAVKAYLDRRNGLAQSGSGAGGRSPLGPRTERSMS